ncbi:MAG: arginine--tRNA ligase [Patescibacteria group bacterium]|nr:arginine--tRNA ligase [Patescibacteria group bacterium]
MIELVKKEIAKVVGSDIPIAVTASEKPEFGHYSTNVAFKLAGQLKKPPFEIARELGEKLKATSDMFSKVEAMAPGFVNFWIAPEVLRAEMGGILKQKKGYGESKVKSPKSKVNLEYVSANPTGPLTMANGRGGFYGHALANVLESAGNKVTREYYVNDAGNQIRLLGESILADLGIAASAENHYKGEYIKDLAKSLKLKVKSKDAEQVGKLAAAILFKSIKASLKKAGIKHDVWFSEDANLHKKNELAKTLEFLKKKGATEEKDGALWLGDGVLVKSDGNPTYFLADLAYHYDKLIKRKFDFAIDIWGADHHGYAQRMKKGVEALGVDGDKLKILITQLVRLVSGGKEVRMSKRKGEFVTMDDLIGEVGADAARFFFLMHSLDTHMDFDLDLAKEKSNKNPVYYAQYALVRCSNILLKAKVKSPKSKTDLSLLQSDAAMNLMLELVKFPDLITQTAEDYQVHRLTKYASDIAKALHLFYEKDRVLNAENASLRDARLALVMAAKTVLENLFDLLGVSKPKKM